MHVDLTNTMSQISLGFVDTFIEKWNASHAGSQDAPRVSQQSPQSKPSNGVSQVKSCSYRKLLGPFIIMVIHLMIGIFMPQYQTWYCAPIAFMALVIVPVMILSFIPVIVEYMKVILCKIV